MSSSWVSNFHLGLVLLATFVSCLWPSHQSISAFSEGLFMWPPEQDKRKHTSHLDNLLSFRGAPKRKD